MTDPHEVFSSGRRFWGRLFVVYIPGVGAIIAVIVALAQRSDAQGSPSEVVRENARWAANWALSVTLYGFDVLVAAASIAVITGEAPVDRQPTAWVIGPSLVLAAVGIYCLVTLIRGCVIADRVVHRPALAIPFFRS
ncbi:DUF4870 domain-containing protein [uncultured Microbacterium sp.]|uniref:DUF4870 domain-containing protein n=1 Tax=uncultured Microbacterium sp. TaxID=191216 RepID=UPI0028DCBE9B|nr:DUF4870 domain-containing protein [uncultured Microbacterium sp.]